MKKILETLKIKWAEYLLEMIVIIFGILVAFMLNNWYQNRLDTNLEAKYHGRLLEDLKEEIEIIQATLNYSHQVRLHAKKAIAIFENSVEIRSNPVENLIDMYQASQLIDPNSATSTYKELIASGRINLIKNDSLKTALIRYYEIEWPEIEMFKIPNKYRENLRGKMPSIIQTEIRAKCGDIYYKIRKGFQVALPKTCDVDIEINVAQPIVEFLRNDESLKKDLRYLIGNETSKMEHLNSTKRQLEDLIGLFENIGNN